MSEDPYREDCDPCCKGHQRIVNGQRTECCGGCPAQCLCRLEAEADLATMREEEAEQQFYEDDDSFREYQEAKREGAF